MYYRLLLLAFFCLLFTNCNTKKENDSSQIVSNRISIDESSILDYFDIRGIIEDIDIIPLREKSGNLLGEINKLIVYNNQFIVCDMLKSQKILLFDSAGRFIKEIIATGEGPNVPLQISDFWKDKNKFFVYDHSLKKIFILDSNFKFLNTVKTNDHIYHNVRNIEDDRYVGYSTFKSGNEVGNEGNYELQFLDNKFNEIKSDFPFPEGFEDILIISFRSHLNKISDTTRYIRPYDNTIYNYINEELVNTYTIEYKNNELTREKFEGIVRENISSFKKANSQGLEEVRMLLSGYSYFYNNLIENSKVMTFTSIVDGQIVFTVYDKLKNKVVVNSNFLHEKEKYNTIIPKFIFADENYFYGIVDSFYLDQFILGDSVLKKYSKSSTSSFLLVRIKFK